MSITTHDELNVAVAMSGLPPYVDGQRVARAEFRRLRDLHPDIKHVERIDGVIVMPAARRFQAHGKPHNRLDYWLTTYELATDGLNCALACTVAIDSDNDPEPDSVLFISQSAGGQCAISEDDYLEGSPELIAEVSASTKRTDLGRKLEIYEVAAVEEYIVWLTEQSEIRWFRLRNGKYEQLQPDDRGIIRSEVFPGLWLDVPAMLKLEMRQVLAVWNEGLASPEHAAFVALLQARMQSNSGG